VIVRDFRNQCLTIKFKTMKKVNELKKKKAIKDLLDKKFERMDKIVGGVVAVDGCYTAPWLPANTGVC
jgi:hypothetical protein